MAEGFDASIREWLYLDAATNAQKGPIAASVLIKMLEKGAGVTGTTMCWKAGMNKWKAMSDVDPFASVAQFQALQWYFIDTEKQQRGPMISRMIMHKVRRGEIDGFTLVYSSITDGEWKKLSDVDVLKQAILQMTAEEEAAEAAANAIAQQSETTQQVYFIDEDDTTPQASFAQYQAAMAAKQAALAAISGGNNQSKSSDNVGQVPLGSKKAFRADSGVKYQWDDVENDWVECENDDGDDEEEVAEPVKVVAKVASSSSSSSKKRPPLTDDANGDDDDDGEDEDDADGTTGATSESSATGQVAPKRKRNKKKKKKAAPTFWLYVSGLPKDVTMEEIKEHFSKVGLIAISPVDCQSKIRIYRDPETNECKGDCSLCYHAEASMLMALDVLDGGYIRPAYKITVKRAEFTQGEGTAGSSGGGGGGGAGGNDKGHSQQSQPRAKPSTAQVRVARAAMNQALAWNEEDDLGLSSSSALKIVVIEGMFVPQDFNDESFSDMLEQDIATECGKCGQIEKITVFSKHIKGVVIVKFSTSYAAQECVRSMNGRFFGGKQLRSYFWDGQTDFSASNEPHAMEDEEKHEVAR